MSPKLAAGITWDFVSAASKSAWISTAVVSPLFFLCCLITRVPRERESRSQSHIGWFGRGRLS